MSEKIRKFGVDDPDEYWKWRKDIKRTTERRLHRFLKKQIDAIVPKGGRVLDCGMGAGHVFRLCLKEYETFGVEMSSEAIAMYDFPTDNVKQADLNQGIPDFNVKFDAIVISMILHWMDDPLKFLIKIQKKLTPKGRLLVVIPNITYYRYRIGFLFGKFPPISLSHKNFQVPPESEEMFKRAGLIIEKILTSKTSLKARLWPRLFATGIIYVLKPEKTSSSPCR
ncbi:MAG: class I SAM-dependent methyltransferase [Desulfobulbaceae bacterium]|nr:class I SAM-dependent methyltransferase [Desulfobulbaceae bacterium]MCK5323163.1 class I SAM-dependent methyltransferase [Desulfobulbaceae bacterium]MCK5436592.1 class I SAM-dependent methyltransferase [Desulfobulbaceae bacterium]